MLYYVEQNIPPPQGALALQGSGLGLAFNAMTLYMTDQSAEARLGNSLGILRMVQQMASMLGQTLVAALVDDGHLRQGGAAGEGTTSGWGVLNSTVLGEAGVADAGGGAGGSRAWEAPSIARYRLAASVALWLSVLFALVPVWLCGYGHGVKSSQVACQRQDGVEIELIEETSSALLEASGTSGCPTECGEIQRASNTEPGAPP